MSELSTTTDAPDVSVVIPLLDEEESLTELFQGIKTHLEAHNYSFEVLFVDDGSTDNSWKVIKNLSSLHPQAHGIKHFRNYGKSAALQNGFDRVKGRYVITMDADLQDDPSELPDLIQKLKDGADLVSGWKKKRYDPISKTLPSKFFNAVTSSVSGIKLHDFNCGLKAYKVEVIKRVRLYGEMHRYIPFLAKNEGFKNIEEQVVQHHARKYGVSKFGLSRFVNGFLDLMTLVFVSRYQTRPMHFFGLIGSLFMFAGLGVNLYLAVIKLFFNASLSNRPLLLLGMLLMMLGAQFFCTGFIGELINKNGQKSSDNDQVAEFVD